MNDDVKEELKECYERIDGLVKKLKWQEMLENTIVKQDSEIERLRKILRDVLETIPEHIPFGTMKKIRSALQQKEIE